MKCLACTSQKLSARAHTHCQDSKRLVHASRFTDMFFCTRKFSSPSISRHPSQVPTTSCRNRAKQKERRRASEWIEPGPRGPHGAPTHVHLSCAGSSHWLASSACVDDCALSVCLSAYGAGFLPLKLSVILGCWLASRPGSVAACLLH